MIFRQYLHTNPVATAYFFGCGSQSQGVIVDPLEDQVEFYIEESKRLGMDIRFVIDTHLHADHISGGRILAEKTGAKYMLHSSAETAYEYTPVDDGDEIVAGNTVLKILHTPGHTPEHISILVTDKVRGNEPWFVLTGHTLMVGDVGRTELATDVKQGASILYHSIFDKLLRLEDHLEIYPGAFSGSVCGRGLSGKPSTTIAFEKRFSKALQKASKEEFISFMTENIPPQPENFQTIRRINQGLEK
jgi:hydroxyacylglutathione hydrolase